MKEVFIRSTNNPILSPDPSHPWEARKIYNPGAVVDDKGLVHLFYRAVGSGSDWHSSLGHAVFDKDKLIKRYSQPALDRDPDNPHEKRGLEDPRIVNIDGTYFMTYAAYDGLTPRLHIATSSDLKNWQKNRPALPEFNFTKMGGRSVRWKQGQPIESEIEPEKNEWNKAGAMFPERINDEYWMLFNEFRIWLARSQNGIQWQPLKGPFLKPRPGKDYFDNIFVETGPPPIKTDKGWLVFYHGINDAIQYHLGLLLLDLEDPSHILYRSNEPIFGPRDQIELSGIVDIIPGAIKLLERGDDDRLKSLLKQAEQEGFMPQVTFCPGAVVLGDEIHIYYGAGDSYICTASASLRDILALLP